MKIFTQENSFFGRINFIDKNNVVVGWSNDASCCESFGWFISKEKYKLKDDDVYPEELSEIKDLDLDPYEFNPKFFETQEIDKGHSEGGIAIFELTHEDNKLYLHFHNYHNGYYGHGFEMAIKTPDNKETTIHEGVL